ncbi:MAG TPA: hypothetical protein VMF10_15410, partial [Candidatus Aquilonibacter sp.]|nr:hypothetical protein [Candidatus Aquilonibacter sp.]
MGLPSSNLTRISIHWTARFVLLTGTFAQGFYPYRVIWILKRTTITYHKAQNLPGDVKMFVVA